MLFSQLCGGLAPSALHYLKRHFLVVPLWIKYVMILSLSTDNLGYAALA